MLERRLSVRKLAAGALLALMVVLGTAAAAQAAAPAQAVITSGTAGESKVKITWKAVKKAETYNIYVKKGSGKKQLLKSRSADKKTSVNITNLKNRVTYTFYISAVNSDGEEGKLSKGYKLTPAVTKPGRVTGLTITKLGSTSVTLTWTADSKATKYIIEQKLSDGSYKRLTTTTNTKITLKGLTTDTSYQLGVRAYRRAGGASAIGYLSELVTVTPTTLTTALASIHPYNTSTYATDSSIVYPANIAEAYVNKDRKWDSPNNQLIWINTYTQHLYFFTGSAGKWKLQKCYICATGVSGATPLGRTMIYGKATSAQGMVKFSSIQWAYWATYIGSGAIHSWLYYPDGREWAMGKLGVPSSHGCVRLQLANAKYIYDTLKVGTYVYVW